MPIAVRINTAGQVVGVDNPAGVSKSLQEELLWIPLGNGGPWTITFDKASGDPSTYPIASGSPFSQTVFVVNPGSPTPSGPVTTGLVGRTYRYNVRQGTSPTGPIKHDPDVDVES